MVLDRHSHIIVRGMCALILAGIISCFGCGHYSIWYYRGVGERLIGGTEIGTFSDCRLSYGFHGGPVSLNFDSIYLDQNPGAELPTNMESYFTVWLRVEQRDSAFERRRVLSLKELVVRFSDDTASRMLFPINDHSFWDKQRQTFIQSVTMGLCVIPDVPTADSVVVKGQALLLNTLPATPADTVDLDLIGIVTEYRRSRVKDFLDMNQ